MALEWRGSSLCYYRKERHAGRVRSVYCGSGEYARLMHSIAQRDRHERQAAQQQQQAAVDQDRQLLTQLRDIERDTRTLVHAVLVCNGYHQHKRQWRKARMLPQLKKETHPAPSAPLVLDSTDPNTERAREGYRALTAALLITVEPTGKSEKAINIAKATEIRDQRRAVRQALNDYPEMLPTLRRYLEHAHINLVKAGGGGTVDSVSAMLLDSAARGVRATLGNAKAPPLEQLLIEQIAVAWLDLEIVTSRYASDLQSSHSFTLGAYWDKRITSAQARYLRAVETLARVRKLAQPTPLQVNIGGQQVNVAGAAPAPAAG